jgi:aconitate hydratase
MGYNITQKIISAHLVEGETVPGTEIGLKIDQTLTQDATGTMVYLEFEAMGFHKAKTEISVSYVDHNTLQTGFENADDHLFLQSAAAKFGLYFSRAGNGICHQVHLERFGKPGKILLGSDSHTPTGGGMGMLAIGAGGLDVAAAMAGYPYHLQMPRIVNIRLHGKPAPWISAKDIILEVLRILSVKGGLEKVIEYTGDGISYLEVPERATITNMGAELGATSSIFPSDDLTKKFLKAQDRENAFVKLLPDHDAVYDETLDIDIDKLEPLIALPHMPDNVVKVSEIAGKKVDQVFIGSCTNSSYADLMRVSEILKGKTVNPGTSLAIAPGSRQVLHALASNGALAILVKAGARILESACGPCIGAGQAPPSKGVSLRTSNRNFKGRSGTADAEIYLVSCETAAAAAISGQITDPRELGAPIKIKMPESFNINDKMIIPPSRNGEKQKLIMGPNIKSLPGFPPLPETIETEVLLIVGDNITTDDIMPASAEILPLRSNLPAISQHAFARIDPTFAGRAKEVGSGIIIGGENYGQGSSREHAALAPRYLGIKVALTKSFARIHLQNLVNFGILPLVFNDKEDYNDIKQGDIVRLTNAKKRLRDNLLEMENITKKKTYKMTHTLSQRQMEIVVAGGLLEFLKKR